MFHCCLHCRRRGIKGSCPSIHSILQILLVAAGHHQPPPRCDGCCPQCDSDPWCRKTSLSYLQKLQDAKTVNKADIGAKHFSAIKIFFTRHVYFSQTYLYISVNCDIHDLVVLPSLRRPEIYSAKQAQNTECTGQRSILVRRPAVKSRVSAPCFRHPVSLVYQRSQNLLPKLSERLSSICSALSHALVIIPLAHYFHKFSNEVNVSNSK